MYPKVCPACNKQEQRAGQGFEHVSLLLRGQGRGTLHVRCKRCGKIFPVDYGEPAAPARELTVTTKATTGKKRANGAVP